MCRNIKPLFNFEPPATEEEIRSASVQFVRKISGFNQPSKANEAAFLAAVEAIAAISSSFLSSLETNAPPKNRAEEAAKAQARAIKENTIVWQLTNPFTLANVTSLANHSWLYGKLDG